MLGKSLEILALVYSVTYIYSFICLKRHALKLQQQKQKEALQLEQQRERELEKERSLVAKMAKKPMKSSQPASKDGHSEAARLSPAPPHQGAAHTPIAGETMDSTQDENEVKS